MSWAKAALIALGVMVLFGAIILFCAYVPQLIIGLGEPYSIIAILVMAFLALMFFLKMCSPGNQGIDHDSFD